MSGITALVTGAAGGLGQAILHALQPSGAHLVGWDRAALPAGLCDEEQTVDLCDRDQISSATSAFLSRHGAPDILINNAGIQGKTAPLALQEDADWDRVIAINLTSAFLLCRAFLPAMMARGSGRVINIASVAGLRGLENGAAYGAAKAGLIGLTQGLAKEAMQSGVTINAIAPALTHTPLLDQMGADFIAAAAERIPMGRLALPQEVAAMTAWVASPACSFTTGAVFDVSGGRLGI